MLHDSVVLQIFANASDQFNGVPLYQAIVQELNDSGISGVTVLKGIQGFGSSGVIHSATLFGASTELPIKIEVVENEDKLRPLLPRLVEMTGDNMITLRRVSARASR